jgi:hypothetical protein
MQLLRLLGTGLVTAAGLATLAHAQAPETLEQKVRGLRANKTNLWYDTVYGYRVTYGTTDGRTYIWVVDQPDVRAGRYVVKDAGATICTQYDPLPGKERTPETCRPSTTPIPVMTVDGDVLALAISKTREALKSSFEPKLLPSPFKGVRPLNQAQAETPSPSPLPQPQAAVATSDATKKKR